MPPRLRAETIDRSDLVVRRLSSPARLAVVSGPAGCGKSTLLAQCHAVDPFPAWLSLETADNDPVALWWSFIAAVRTIIGEFGQAYRERLLVGGSAVLDAVVASVCNELDDRAMPVHLFLDDLHLVDNPESRRSLHRFVASMPAGVRVTMASRESSPIPLARLRVDGDLIEIDASDLTFSPDQAREMLDHLGNALDPAHVDLLMDRTEGWPAGLQLAGLAISRVADVGAFVEDFSGTDRDVAEYLVREVLESVSDEERDFMVRTSILRRLTGDLCDAVAEREDSAELLAHLEDSNAFVIALDRDGLWYRYHHLFAELLDAELHRTHRDDVKGLHTLAFEWLRGHDQIAEAIPHAIAAGETDAAADLVCRHWFGLMNSGRLATVQALLAGFRPEYIAEHQPLAIAAALAHGMSGDPQTARGFLDAAERATYDLPPPDGSASMEAALALARATLALDGIDAALVDGRTAYELEPHGSPWHTLAALDVGIALVLRGDVEKSTPFFEEVERDGDPTMRAYALAELSLGQLVRGDAERASKTAAAATESVHDAGVGDLIMAAVSLAAASLAAIALGDERAARVALRAATRPLETVGFSMPMDRTHARLLLARAALALGEFDLARRHLDDATRVAAVVPDIGAMREEITALGAQLATVDDGAGEDGGPDFTEREIEVIALLPTPLTTREIGEELFLSRNTIKTYLRRVYRKLNASSRDEAVLIAQELGLLTD
jgi:LuxR family maltose regulon positive regulatory protein